MPLSAERYFYVLLCGKRWCRLWYEKQRSKAKASVLAKYVVRVTKLGKLCVDHREIEPTTATNPHLMRAWHAFRQCVRYSPHPSSTKYCTHPTSEGPLIECHQLRLVDKVPPQIDVKLKEMARDFVLGVVHHMPTTTNSTPELTGTTGSPPFSTTQFRNQIRRRYSSLCDDQRYCTENDVTCQLQLLENDCVILERYVCRRGADTSNSRLLVQECRLSVHSDGSYPSDCSNS